MLRMVPDPRVPGPRIFIRGYPYSVSATIASTSSRIRPLVAMP
jgi:hypothetical protein